MNIALLHYSAPPIVGGVEQVMGVQARLLAKHGHAVRILAGRGGQLEGPAAAGVAFHSLPLVDSTHPEVLAVKAELDRGQVTPRFWSLVEQIEAQLAPALDGVQVIIAHNVCSLHKNLALTAALQRLSAQAGAPRLILWHHDLAWTAPRYQAELHPGFPWDLLCTPWPGAVQVVVSAMRQAELADLLGQPDESIHVVPNGVDPAQFYKWEAQTVELAERLDLPSATPVLLLPVRITARKNIELALETLAALKADYPQAALVVTGPLGAHNPANADYFQRLLALRARLGLETSAHFLAEQISSYLPDAVIADFYRAADALFLPSREEGFGIPLLEAGLAGIPVFCADIEPLRKLGGDLVHYFSPDADPREVAGQIRAVLAQSAEFALRVRVRRQYTWAQVYADHIAPLLLDLEK